MKNRGVSASIRFPALVPVSQRAHSLDTAETLGEVAGGGEAQHTRDLGKRHAGFRQEVQAFLDTAGQ